MRMFGGMCTQVLTAQQHSSQPMQSDLQPEVQMLRDQVASLQAQLIISQVGVWARGGCMSSELYRILCLRLLCLCASSEAQCPALCFCLSPQDQHTHQQQSAFTELQQRITASSGEQTALLATTQQLAEDVARLEAELKHSRAEAKAAKAEAGMCSHALDSVQVKLGRERFHLGQAARHARICQEMQGMPVLATRHLMLAVSHLTLAIDDIRYFWLQQVWLLISVSAAMRKLVGAQVLTAQVAQQERTAQALRDARAELDRRVRGRWSGRGARGRKGVGRRTGEGHRTQGVDVAGGTGCWGALHACVGLNRRCVNRFVIVCIAPQLPAAAVAALQSALKDAEDKLSTQTTEVRALLR